ncbi:hypothetical protein C1646_763614 [Rhizophagus diaphanus]|nr:hypothetical protein C1646_763614 [Rhizophagus diaphanus] [Rhizophagus sp. MUCL 43196]
MSVGLEEYDKNRRDLECIQQSAERIIKAMGWSLNEFGLDDSTVNKGRQTQVLFEEIRKTNVEQIAPKDRLKLIVSSKSLDEEEIVDINNKYSKSAKEEKSKELPVTEEDMNLYDQVNRNCSSRLPEISKEEISRVVSSSESDRESESENIATEVACKKSGQVGKEKKDVR